ncbi:MAG: iron uptake porin [Mastigocoleus sp.]
MNKKYLYLFLGVSALLFDNPATAENIDNNNVLIAENSFQEKELQSSNLSSVNLDANNFSITHPVQFEPEFSSVVDNRFQSIDNLQNLKTRNFFISDSGGMEKVTSVSELSDVETSDWAFQALQSLVERYGVIAGYPKGIFKGNQAMTRYEFAAALNAILVKINELITTGVSDSKVNQQDLQIIQKLKEEFAAELTTLEHRIDNLETGIATVKAQQFSSTAVLRGQTILGVVTGSGGGPPGGIKVLPDNTVVRGKPQTNIALNHLTQLQLFSSFTGKDAFRAVLVTGNTVGDGLANPESFNTNMARLSWQANYNNQIKLDSLEYRFATLGDRAVFTVKPVGFSLGSILSPNSPYANAGYGAISYFAGSTPVFKIGSLDSGFGVDWLVADKLRLQIAYGTRSSKTKGLFNANNSALGVQLLYKPTSSLITGFSYVNAYSKNGQLDTGTGSANADTSGGVNEPAQIHAINASIKWRLANNLSLGAWGGLMVTDYLQSDAVTLSSTYLMSLGLYDPFGRKGDMFGILVGQPPKLNAGYLIEDVDDGNSTHYEVFYRFLVNDYIAITPGFFVVTDPGHISSNNDIFVGAIRTTFSF